MYDIDILTLKLFTFILVLNRTTDKWSKPGSKKQSGKNRNINLWWYILHHTAFQ